MFGALKLNMFGASRNTHSGRPATFDDDEPLPSHPTPPPLPTSSPLSAATITTVPEFPAVAAFSPSPFAVLVHVRAPPAPASTRDRTPIDLVAVLDVSGSMHGNKIALLKRAVGFIINTLSPSDRLSVVSFSGHADRVLSLTCMSDTGRVRATSAVDALKANGSTNIKHGLEMGMRVLDQRRHRNPVAGVILLSDGQDTDGQRYSYHQEESKSYSSLLPSNTTVPIHTFGFGSDHDPRAMHKIADATGGTFSFIEAEGDIQDAFAMCIGGLLSVAAQKVELMVSIFGEVRISSVSSGSYQSKVINHGLGAVIEFGDLYADEEKDILVNVSVPAAGEQPLMQLLAVKCSYKEPLTQQAVHVDGEVAVIRRPDVLLPEDAMVSLRVDGQRNRLLVGESVKKAQEMAEKGDFDGAKEVLTNRRAALLATASAQAGDGLCGWLETELSEIQKRMENSAVYEECGRAYALAGMGAHLRQRSVAGANMRTEDDYLEACALNASLDSDDDEGFSLFDDSGPSHENESFKSKIGYRTDAMREMVKKSQMYAADEPSNSKKGNGN